MPKDPCIREKYKGTHGRPITNVSSYHVVWTVPKMPSEVEGAHAI